MDLHLNLKKEYFYQIKNGEKKEEYRLANEYWEKRLKNKSYNKNYIKLGYPKKDDIDKILIFKYNGYKKRIITNKEFGDKPIEVYAINLELKEGDNCEQ